MGADGAEGPDLALGGPDDDARLATELEDGCRVETSAPTRPATAVCVAGSLAGGTR
jgi:hypothetical protein